MVQRRPIVVHRVSEHNRKLRIAEDGIAKAPHVLLSIIQLLIFKVECLIVSGGMETHLSDFFGQTFGSPEFSYCPM
jgi:hypothetical protein